jgi:hypothetical protein
VDENWLSMPLPAFNQFRDGRSSDKGVELGPPGREAHVSYSGGLGNRGGASWLS